MAMLYMLQWKCVISDFMKSLKFSVTSWNYRFSRGFHETTEIPSYFMKSLKISTELFTILLTWIVRALGNLWNRICRAYPQLDTGPQIRFAPQIGDIKDMLVVWLADSNTSDWIGIKFVQFQKNSAHHSGINCTPYSAMFGCEAGIGVTSSLLPAEVIATLQLLTVTT